MQSSENVSLSNSNLQNLVYFSDVFLPDYTAYLKRTVPILLELTYLNNILIFSEDISKNYIYPFIFSMSHYIRMAFRFCYFVYSCIE